MIIRHPKLNLFAVFSSKLSFFSFDVFTHMFINHFTLFNLILFLQAESVKLVANGKAPKIPQPEEGATYDPMLNKKELCKINWDQSAEAIHNFIRGLDSSPGAWTVMDGKEVSCDVLAQITSLDPRGI